MAVGGTFHPETLQDFLECVYGDFSEHDASWEDQEFWFDIICPENAVWDFNALDPLGRITNFQIAEKAHIQGRGTTIKNYNGSVSTRWYHVGHPKANRPFTEKLHFQDMFATKAIPFDDQKFSECKFSVQLGKNIRYIFSGGVVERCSVNADVQGTKFCPMFSSVNVSPGHNYMKYCRIKVTAPNADDAIPSWSAEGNDLPGEILSSELIYNAPNATGLKLTRTYDCTVRGDLTHMGSAYCILQPGDANAVCIPASASSLEYMYNDIQFMWQHKDENYGGKGVEYFELCTEIYRCIVTDSQLKDISYLHSIGFGIGQN